ncbi:SDR family NAD(P)-dependent oxidoreductase [Aeromonas hydrophila]|uniref:SDR family NAD(P)-dependent oxidoreductase n=1 Tax=Aeromonas hydrophila TaxID=644 RepID=UPI001C5AE843|nr:SDR family NAD(P)-dependent oxidoreductase [Aeromonas hydrophila]MBW3833478.1 SDR family NAD(P)-dependent oxidoreductase [Aeromonas hydrophila]MBW5263636.1 SDR family NAD(P)-dependent oxidoreductase [Aeromonas hydrophila]MBW5278755.1 SDR family NAD(P)-dependent oxidoreductase [Aeromonas hydrophila]
MEESVVVIGAGGGLGSALVEHWLAAGTAPVIAVSRQPQPAGLNSSKLHWLCCDYSDEQLAEVVARIGELAPRPRWLVICNGLLQQGSIRPEKRLEALNLEAMTQLYQTNALLPLRWISQLLPLLGSSPCTLAVLSARVGSIGDNRAGGWYGYRAAKAALNMLLKCAAKAALNMLLKCAAIELARRAPGVKLLAFHPGTVDTALSRPFHGNLAAGSLHSPQQAAAHLVTLMAWLTADGELSYLDWRGEPIEW